MQHYWGHTAIMERMDLHSHATLYRWIKQKGLPVYRRKPHKRQQHQMYTNEGLIIVWELAQARAYRESLKPIQSASQSIDAGAKDESTAAD